MDNFPPRLSGTPPEEGNQREIIRGVGMTQVKSVKNIRQLEIPEEAFSAA